MMVLVFRYEKEGRAKRVVKAQQLWYAIIESQTETGTPYMVYKDACNRKSNQQNLGTIKSSNLCTEIVEYTSKDEVRGKRCTGHNKFSFLGQLCVLFCQNLFSVWFVLLTQVAVCNLASIAVNMYVTPEKTYDFKKLASVTKVIVKNLNKIIDINFYPVPEVWLPFWCCSHAAGFHKLYVNITSLSLFSGWKV